MTERCLEQVNVESRGDLGNLMNWIDRVPHNVSVLVTSTQKIPLSSSVKISKSMLFRKVRRWDFKNLL